MTLYTLLVLLTGEITYRTNVDTLVVEEEEIFCTFLTEAVLITFSTVDGAEMALFVISIVAVWTVVLAGVIQQKVLGFTAQTGLGAVLAGCTLWCARLTHIASRKPPWTLRYTHSIVQIQVTVTPLTLCGVLACHTPLHAVLTLPRGLVTKRTGRTARHARLLSSQKAIWIAAAARFLSCTVARLADGVAQLTFILTASEVILGTQNELSALQALPVLQYEAVLTRVTVVITWPSTRTTRTVTRLTLLALLVHKKAFLTAIHTFSG